MSKSLNGIENLMARVTVTTLSGQTLHQARHEETIMTFSYFDRFRVKDFSITKSQYLIFEFLILQYCRCEKIMQSPCLARKLENVL